MLHASSGAGTSASRLFGAGLHDRKGCSQFGSVGERKTIENAAKRR